LRSDHRFEVFFDSEFYRSSGNQTYDTAIRLVTKGHTIDYPISSEIN